MAGVTRLELATSGVTGQRSNRLSYTPEKGRRNLSEVFCRSSELEKNDPDNRRQGGGCGEHRRRNVPLPGSVRHALPLGRLCQPPNLAPTKVAGPCTVSGLNQGKMQDKNGGEGGIRTPVTLSSNHAFQACAFNHSATSPASGLSLCEMQCQAASYLNRTGDFHGAKTTGRLPPAGACE